jgi:mono/diheme cytochrome c family protein
MERFIRDGRLSGSKAERAGGRLLGLVVLALLLAPCQGSAQGKKLAKVSPQEYEGWRQYSVHCARCHGQDVLGNPVAADLLKTTAPGGSTASQEAFVNVVLNGRTARGMPALGKTLTPGQAAAIHAYVKGRAEGRIPAGRPAPPA